MARPIFCIMYSHGSDTDLAKICSGSTFRFTRFVHRNPSQDADLIQALQGLECDILIDRGVQLGDAAIGAIRARLGRGDPPTQLALLPRLSIPQKLPGFIGGLFDQVRWESAQKAYRIAVDRACARPFTDLRGESGLDQRPGTVRVLGEAHNA